jgi:hypothetical protein
MTRALTTVVISPKGLSPVLVPKNYSGTTMKRREGRIVTINGISLVLH